MQNITTTVNNILKKQSMSIIDINTLKQASYRAEYRVKLFLTDIQMSVYLANGFSILQVKNILNSPKKLCYVSWKNARANLTLAQELYIQSKKFEMKLTEKA